MGTGMRNAVVTSYEADGSLMGTAEAARGFKDETRHRSSFQKHTASH